MSRSRFHPNKDINLVIQEAVDLGWTFEPAKGGGHSVGFLKCPHVDSGEQCRGGQYCRMAVYSTPRNPTTAAKQIATKVKRCKPPTEVNRDDEE